MLNKALLIGKAGRREGEKEGTDGLDIHMSSENSWLTICNLDPNQMTCFPTLVFGAAHHCTGATGNWSCPRPHVNLNRSSNPFSDTEERTQYTHIFIYRWEIVPTDWNETEKENMIPHPPSPQQTCLSLTSPPIRIPPRLTGPTQLLTTFMRLSSSILIENYICFLCPSTVLLTTFTGNKRYLYSRSFIKKCLILINAID